MRENYNSQRTQLHKRGYSFIVKQCGILLPSFSVFLLQKFCLNDLAAIFNGKIINECREGKFKLPTSTRAKEKLE